jgi:hypothetical protein
VGGTTSINLGVDFKWNYCTACSEPIKMSILTCGLNLHVTHIGMWQTSFSGLYTDTDYLLGKSDLISLYICGLCSLIYLAI